MWNPRRFGRFPGYDIALALLLGLSFGAARPSLAQGSDEAWAPVTIVFSSDVKGHIEPCG